MKERAADLGEKRLRERLLDKSLGTRNFGPNNLLPAGAFLIQLRQFAPNSRVLWAVTLDTTVCTTLQTLLSTLYVLELRELLKL